VKTKEYDSIGQTLLNFDYFSSIKNPQMVHAQENTDLQNPYIKEKVIKIGLGTKLMVYLTENGNLYVDGLHNRKEFFFFLGLKILFDIKQFLQLIFPNLLKKYL
jgi:hypothetical protein